MPNFAKAKYYSSDSSDESDAQYTKNLCDEDYESESDIGEADILETFAKEASECETLGRKRRRRKRVVTICTANSRYEVVRRVAYRLGMREVSEDDTWNLFWTDLSISVERCKEMKRFQKVNHFPGMSEICRKDLLARNLNRMLKLYPEEYSFFPKSWCLPADMADLGSYSRTRKNKTYILKPDVGCQGKGIVITKSIKEVVFRPHEKMICQVYITRPFLIDGYKFDLRLYTLITSCDPLRIYVYNDGLVRLATSRYKEPTGGNAANIFMHLTNYAVNKHNRMFIVDDESGSKRKVSTLNRWLHARGYDVAAIWSSIDDVIVKTMMAAHPMLKHSYHTCFPTHDYTYACFEILGFDVLLDDNLKPFVLEVNHSPSFHTDSQIDRDIKESLLRDTFQLLNLKQCDKRKILEEDRRRVKNRLLKGIYKQQSSGDGELASARPLSLQTQWEDTHKGNFRKIYPCDGCEKYDKFFHQNASSLFQDTAASRAREEASRVQRESSLTKAKQEAARRAGARLLLEKIRPESPRSKLSNKPSLRRLRELQLAKSFSNSFEPNNIIEAEEMERIYQLRQREFLVKSYGLIEQIYLCLKNNRVLRQEGDNQMGICKSQIVPALLKNFHEKLDTKSESLMEVDKVPTTKANNDLKSDKAGRNTLTADQPSSSYCHDEKGLCVWSNEATISQRPLPGAKWPFLPMPPVAILPALSLTDVRSTKAQVARSFTNNAKLRQLERRQTINLHPRS